MDMFAPAFPTKKIEFAEEEEHNGCSAEKRNQAQCAPENRVTARGIANHGIVRKIICVRECFAGAIRRGGPGRPGEESGQLLDLFWILNMFDQQTPV